MFKVMWQWRRRKYLNTLERSVSKAIVVRLAILILFAAVALFVPPIKRKINAEDLYQNRAVYSSSYVPTWLMLLIVLLIPVVVFLADKHTSNNDIEFSQVTLSWTLSLSINALITEMLKIIVGRPRPDFFYRCFPDGKMTLMPNGNLDCTGDYRTVWEGRKSFPSGHSSFSFCSLGFISLWMCGRWSLLCRKKQWLRAVLCITPLILSSLISVSRIYDNRHHWEDVVAGCILGLLSSYFSYNFYYNSILSEYAGVPKILTSDTYLKNPTHQIHTQPTSSNPYYRRLKTYRSPSPQEIS